MGDADYFLGTHFEWTRHEDGHVTVHLSQEGYAMAFVEAMGQSNANASARMTPYRSGLPIDTLPPVEMAETDREKLRSRYQSVMGMLNWLSISTQPDLTTVHSLLASATQLPTPAHMDGLRHVARYVKGTVDYGISFSSRPNKNLESYVNFPMDPSKMIPFADSNWGPQDASQPNEKNMREVSIDETKSICGHVIFMAGGPLLWKSHKEKRNSHSSCEAEVKATDECTKSVQWFRNVLDDLSLLPPAPTKIWNDNQGAVNWANTTSHKAMRHVNIRESCVREAIHVFKEVQVDHIEGKRNMADIFTKEHKSDETFLDIRDCLMSRRGSV